MPHVEAIEIDGVPHLRIVAPVADEAIMAELAAMGKSPGPDEAAVVIDGHFLLEYVCGAINAEMARQQNGSQESPISEPL